MLITIQTFSFTKIHLKMSSGKWRLFCLGLNVLTYCVLATPYIDTDMGPHWLRLPEAPNHYLNQCKLIISEVSWHSPKGKITVNAVDICPDSKVHGANMGPTWVLSAPDWPHVGPMNLAIRVSLIWVWKWLILRLHLHLPRTTDLTHWGRDKMAFISQTTLSNAFSLIKMYEFRLRFHWNLFPRIQLIIFQHWFR